MQYYDDFSGLCQAMRNSGREPGSKTKSQYKRAPLQQPEFMSTDALPVPTTEQITGKQKGDEERRKQVGKDENGKQKKSKKAAVIGFDAEFGNDEINADSGP